jgi:hypothetical protein
VWVQLHEFLTSESDGSEWSASRPGCFTPWKESFGTHWIRGCVGHRAGSDAVAKRNKKITASAVNRIPLVQPISWRIFLLATAFSLALGPTQTPIQRVPGVLSVGVKHSGRESDHSPPSSVEVDNAWTYASTLPYVFMV